MLIHHTTIRHFTEQRRRDYRSAIQGAARTPGSHPRLPSLVARHTSDAGSGDSPLAL